jgi:type IV pilus assembly protein PilM
VIVLSDENKIKLNKFKTLMRLDIKDLKKYLNSNKRNKVKKKKDIKKDIISFDINEDFIRIVVGKFYKNSLTVKKCIEVPTPKDSIDDGKITNFELLLNELKDILVKNKIKTKYASFTTNSTLIINREMIIPKVEDDEIETVINYEISKYLPINLNDYIIQTIVIEELEIEEVEKMKVYTICYPEKIAREYNDLLKRLGLKAYSLDIKFNSLNKIINYSQELNSKNYEIENQNAFIDIGSKYTDINIYKSGEIDFTRIIKLGHSNIEEYVIDKDKEYGVDYLIEEVERIFQFYKNKTRGNKIDKVYLLGDGSRLEGLEDYISDRISIPTEIIHHIGFVEFSSKDICHEDVYKYLNAMGTIIRL